MIIKETTFNEVKELIDLHIKSLTFPFDSYLEDLMINSDFYLFINEDINIGYAAVDKKMLNFFFIKKEYFNLASTLLENFINDNSIEKVHILSQDSFLNRLIIEWNWEKTLEGCFFIDSKNTKSTQNDPNWSFRVAIESDMKKIKEISGDFFDEPSGGFDDVIQRIKAKTMFVLENGSDTLGYGVIEKSQLARKVVSIGMFVNPSFRKMGAATIILKNLKIWAYDNDLEPVAGCWYYNTLSRKSLEAAGMIIATIGYEALLKGKDKLPLRTGNPPGELVN